jgi:CTP synthase
MTKYIFVTGGVISGIGKGVVSASIGAILKALNVSRITIKKLDPYLNIDPGTMNPIEHGEVYVTADGAETDLDLGYYERFANIQVGANNSTSSGRLYLSLLNKERDGEFLGKTVQIIPHFTNEIKHFITCDADEYDVIICEIGGSIGDIEAMAFYETLRQLRNEMGSSIMFVHVTYLVYYETTNELKTKPAQNAIKALNSTGIYPDILICRTEKEELLVDSIRDKLALHTNVPKDRIIMSPNVQSIYEVPLKLCEQGFDIQLNRYCNNFDRNSLDSKADMSEWEELNQKIKASEQSDRLVKVGIIGKYVELHDAYKSLIEAIHHAGIYHGCRIELVWINCRDYDISDLTNIDCFIVPGGFGNTGIERMIDYIQRVRELSKPLLGICLGMQLICVEYARNVCDLEGTIGSAEMGAYDHEIVKVMIDEKRLGGTMRLGLHKIYFPHDSKVKTVYNDHNAKQKNYCKERHRHRYDVNPNYVDTLKENGLQMVGVSEDNLVEVVELSDNAFYVGCQFHPEYKSSPMKPHPLFIELIGAALIAC